MSGAIGRVQAVELDDAVRRARDVAGRLLLLALTLSLLLLVACLALVQNKLRAAPGNAGVRRRLFYYAARTEFQIAGAALPLRRSLRRLNCPFRIRRSSSIPTIVTAAVLNRLNPSIGPMRAFTPR
jgi:hypothetical protein